MTVIPCQQNEELRQKIEEFAETLKVTAHTLGDHGLDEHEFYNSGLFRGAVERIRGQFAATMRDKREFVRHVLNFMQDRRLIRDWAPAGESNRHDYAVTLNNGRVAVIELKGCLDGNNTNIFERPPHANEFIIWSVCTNPSADPRHNAWSGLHTRLSAEIISKQQRIDGVLIWDMMGGTVGRPCPKVTGRQDRLTEVGPYSVPPPCIYVLPATTPSPRNNPSPIAQSILDVEILEAFRACFGGEDDEINYVDFTVGYRGDEMTRTTKIRRGGVEQRCSEPTPIRRA